jgi:hypothetical protein
MTKFLGHPFFLQFCVPLIAVATSVFIKFVTRSDVHKAFKKEDLAVGLDLSITALLIFIVACSKLAKDSVQNPQNIILINKTMSVPWILPAFIAGIWGISTIVRKLGWESDDKLCIFWGIVVPDVFGLLVLLFTVNWIV